jgi:hypothetical protein
MGIEPVMVVGGLLVKSPFNGRNSEVPIFRVARFASDRLA